jgi:hypothetical protein
MRPRYHTSTLAERLADATELVNIANGFSRWPWSIDEETTIMHLVRESMVRVVDSPEVDWNSTSI